MSNLDYKEMTSRHLDCYLDESGPNGKELGSISIHFEKKLLVKHRIVQVQHPLYALDQAPCEFFSSPKRKIPFSGLRRGGGY